MPEPLPTLQVLLVEDKQENIDAWKSPVELVNAEPEKYGFTIHTCYAHNLDEARKFVGGNQIDAAVVDLRLETGSSYAAHNVDGNTVVRELSTHNIAAIAVYSGQTAEADFKGDFPQVEIIPRDAGVQSVIDWLAKQKDLLVTIRKARTQITNEMASIFHTSIWPRWQLWAKVEQDEVTQGIARHVAAHIHETLLSLGKEQAHPEEWYFVPPIGATISTGDLVHLKTGAPNSKDGAPASETWIVITPRCDMAFQADGKRKAEYVQLAYCQDISGDWNALIGQTSANAKDKIKKMIDHGRKLSLHFLPRLSFAAGKDLGPWHVRFDRTLCLPIAQVEDPKFATRFATVTPHFLPSMVERIGSFFSRIGAPNYSSSDE